MAGTAPPQPVSLTCPKALQLVHRLVTASRRRTSLPLCGPRDAFRGGGYVHANPRTGLPESWVGGRELAAYHDLQRRTALAIAGAEAGAHVRRPWLCVRRVPARPRISPLRGATALRHRPSVTPSEPQSCSAGNHAGPPILESFVAHGCASVLAAATGLHSGTACDVPSLASQSGHQAPTADQPAR
jgi:hypothetical protein